MYEPLKENYSRLKFNMQFLSLYCHIPFCRKRCSYCAFNIYTDQNHLISSYLQALQHEVMLLGKAQPVHTIYFGGGTPSLISINQLSKLITTIHQYFSVVDKPEITIEVNPEDITPEKLKNYHQMGINRLSIGMQSALAHELRLFDRNHTIKDTKTVLNQARQAHFDNISIDLIYGLPEQTLADWQQTLRAAIDLEPEHFSLYSLQLENGTQLTQQVNRGELPAQQEDLIATMYQVATDLLAQAGYTQYEISTWSKSGYESRHNQQYWLNLPYLGLGAGAHGSANGLRTINVMRPEIFADRIHKPALDNLYPLTGATQSYEVITPEIEQFETIMLGLRLLKRGLSIKSFENRFDINFKDTYRHPLERFQQQGLLTIQNDHVFLTSSARLIAHHIIEGFLR